MTRAFVTGIGGQDGWLPRRAPAGRRRRGARAWRTRPSRCPTCPASSCTSATSRAPTTSAALVLDLAPDEIYNLAAVSSVARSWEEPDLTARGQRRRRGRAPRHGVPAPGADAAGRSGWCRRPARRSSASPTAPRRTSRTPVATGQPVRRREGVRPPDVRRLPPTAACTPPPRSSTTTSRPAGRPHFVTRKITATVAAIARGEADRLRARQPRRPSRLGLGARLRRRDGARRPRRAPRRLRRRDRRRPLRPRLRRRRVRPRRHRRLGAAASSVDPALVRPADADRARRRRRARRARSSAGRPRSASRSSSRRMVDADAHRRWRRSSSRSR